METVVIHTETGVRCGSFIDWQSAQDWIDQLGVTPEYKARCYKIVAAVDYWKRFYSKQTVGIFRREP